MSWTGGKRSYIVYDRNDPDEGDVLSVEDSRVRALAYHGHVYGYDMVKRDGKTYAENEEYIGPTTRANGSRR
jgi:hypothetical protein